ncbi:hypothetical protein HFN89_07175 [Rhizobium laguerreae]|nr:hypothetical protein [Rhizobium laguerreae]
MEPRQGSDGLRIIGNLLLTANNLKRSYGKRSNMMGSKLNEAVNVDPRDVIMSSRIAGDDGYLKIKMLAKYNELEASEVDLNRLHRNASRMKDVVTVAFVVTAAFMALSAAFPLPRLSFDTLAFGSQHITGLFGLALCALFVFDRWIGYGDKMSAYADLSKRTKALCDRLAFAVRSESEFHEVVEDGYLLRDDGAAQLLGWA